MRQPPQLPREPSSKALMRLELVDPMSFTITFSLGTAVDTRYLLGLARYALGSPREHEEFRRVGNVTFVAKVMVSALLVRSPQPLWTHAPALCPAASNLVPCVQPDPAPAAARFALRTLNQTLRSKRPPRVAILGCQPSQRSQPSRFHRRRHRRCCHRREA